MKVRLANDETMAVVAAPAQVGVAVRETAYGWVALAATSLGVTLLTLPVANEAEAIADVQTAFRMKVGTTVGAAPEAAHDKTVTSLLDRLGRDIVTYYAGEQVDFTSYRLGIAGTPFIQTVRDIVRAIPYGVTRSYGEVAALAGSPGAARAVGQVMATNPVTVVIPCHRVVGSTNRLQGFGGGLPMKEQMLRMEGVAFAAPGRVARG